MTDPRSRASALVVALVAVATSAACFRGTLPPLEYYRLEVRAPETTDLATGDAPLLDGTVSIPAYRAPGLYGDASIAYRIGETQYGTYPSREWALPLGVMLGMATERVFEARPLSTGPAMFDPPSEQLATYVWRGTIREFEEVDRDSEVWAAVALDVQLVRTADAAVVWSGSIRREARVPEGTMPAIVRTLSHLAEQGIADLAAEARTALATGSAAARP